MGMENFEQGRRAMRGETKPTPEDGDVEKLESDLERLLETARENSFKLLKDFREVVNILNYARDLKVPGLLAKATAAYDMFKEAIAKLISVDLENSKNNSGGAIEVDLHPDAEKWMQETDISKRNRA